MKRHSLLIQFSFVVVLCAAASGVVQQDERNRPANDDDQNIEEVIIHAVEELLDMQEGEQNAEWPYEGVYRVRGNIPIGYRVGGTAIVATALIRAPEFHEDQDRQRSISRATRFILDSIDHSEMNPEFDARYDVRGWGYTYAMLYLLELRTTELVTEKQKTEQIDPVIRFYINGIQATEIPESGGWNYSRPRGFKQPGRPSPFMTAPTLQALFAAKAQGFEVDQTVVKRGLDALERGRTPTGSFVYGGTHGERSEEPVPGSVGRMLVSEVTLFLADRSSVERVRGAIDAFFAHWQWLEKRRARVGTHLPPYGVAPYYFYFAHFYAAQAIELMPERDRNEYRQRLRETLMSVQLDEGTWNDRIFPRSANYGTAMAVMSLMMADAPVPAKWSDPDEPDDPAATSDEIGSNEEHTDPTDEQ